MGPPDLVDADRAGKPELDLRRPPRRRGRLFEGWNGTGDCVVLPGEGAYPTADAMGIANDTISGANKNSGQRMHLFFNQSFNLEASPNIEPHTFLRVFPTDHGTSGTIDNRCSSMLMQKP